MASLKRETLSCSVEKLDDSGGSQALPFLGQSCWVLSGALLLLELLRRMRIKIVPSVMFTSAPCIT